MESCIVTQDSAVEASAAAHIGSSVCEKFPRARVHLQKVGARYMVAIHHDGHDDAITIFELSDLPDALDEITPPPVHRVDPPPPPPPPSPSPPDEPEKNPDHFHVYLGAIYGGTSDMLPRPGGSIGFGFGEDDVELHTEARFTGDPAHLWPFSAPQSTPTKVAPHAGADTFSAASTVRIIFTPHTELSPIFGAGIAIDEVAQAHYANTGVAGVLETGVELFHPKSVGIEAMLRADIPAFSVRTVGGPSHAPILTAGAVLRF